MGHRRPSICRLSAELTTEGDSRKSWDSLPPSPPHSLYLLILACYVSPKCPLCLSPASWVLFCLGSISALTSSLRNPSQTMPASAQLPSFGFLATARFQISFVGARVPAWNSKVG